MDKSKPPRSESALTGLKRILNYQWIVKNVPFFLFLAILAVIYIFNGHYADKMEKRINEKQKLIRELQFEYKTVQSELIFRAKASELIRAVEPLGLKEQLKPPIVLEQPTP